MALAGQEQQQHRQLTHQGAGHQDRPVGEVGALEAGQARLDRQGLR